MEFNALKLNTGEHLIVAKAINMLPLNKKMM